MELTKSIFGTCESGDALLYVMRNKATGAQVSITNFGASIVSVKVPDRSGIVEEIALGFDNLDGYIGTHPYFGSTVGRVANRIANARFSLDGKEYHLAANNGENHLHGGPGGFHKRLWRPVAEHITSDHIQLQFSYTSAAGEEAYPGKMDVNLTYRWTITSELSVSMSAQVNQACPINLTNHVYWNLAGVAKSPTILQHDLTLHADRFLPVDSKLIPTGVVQSVQDTPCMDFTNQHRIGDRIAETSGGYDHCYILTPGALVAAKVVDASSGRKMELRTNHIAIQFYSGNFLNGLVGANGVVFNKHAGFCLEPSGYVNAINTPSFPSVVLKPGQVYERAISWRFSTE